MAEDEDWAKLAELQEKRDIQLANKVNCVKSCKLSER